MKTKTMDETRVAESYEEWLDRVCHSGPCGAKWGPRAELGLPPVALSFTHNPGHRQAPNSSEGDVWRGLRRYLDRRIQAIPGTRPVGGDPCAFAQDLCAGRTVPGLFGRPPARRR
jgi:hypothetical protein